MRRTGGAARVQAACLAALSAAWRGAQRYRLEARLRRRCDVSGELPAAATRSGFFGGSATARRSWRSGLGRLRGCGNRSFARLPAFSAARLRFAMQAAATGGLTTTVPEAARRQRLARGGNSARGRPWRPRAGGGRDAMAGVGGGAEHGGAERGWGTILRGSGGGSGGGRRGAATAAAGRPPLSAQAGSAARPAWPALRMARLFFFFLLLGQDGLHHIAGLGDVREIDFGSDGLRGRAKTPRSVRPAARDPRSKCARTFSASSSSRANWSGFCRAQSRVPPRMSRIARALDFHLASRDR